MLQTFMILSTILAIVLDISKMLLNPKLMILKMLEQPWVSSLTKSKASMPLLAHLTMNLTNLVQLQEILILSINNWMKFITSLARYKEDAMMLKTLLEMPKISFLKDLLQMLAK